MEPRLAELKERLGKLTDLRRTEAVARLGHAGLHAPGRRARPARRSSRRSRRSSTSDSSTSGLGELLEELEPYAASLPHDSDDASLIRVAQQRLGPRRAGCPPSSRREFARGGGESYEVVGEGARGRPTSRPSARGSSASSTFAAATSSASRRTTTRTTSCSRTTSRACGPPRSARSSPCSSPSYGSSSPRTRRTRTTSSCAARSRSRRRTRSHASSCEAFGATWDQFRLDTTVHPFEITFGLGDVRLTSRYAEDDLLSLFTAMHECGHGLYEWGVSPTLERTPLCIGRVGDAARVAEPPLGERRRALAAVLALVLPAPAGDVPGPARRRARSRTSTGR